MRIDNVSHIQWHGNIWEPGQDKATVACHIWPPESACPRIEWHIHIRRLVRRDPSDPTPPKTSGWINIEILSFLLPIRDWRDLAGLEIRADAAWHEANEHHGEYGSLTPGEIHLRATHLANSTLNPTDEVMTENWIGHDWHLRIGARHGTTFPCEIDAWLLPEDEYYREHPENPSELARFGQGPPDLRILTNLTFDHATICVPPAHDPVPYARTIARQLIALDEAHTPRIDWAVRASADHKTTTHVVGGPSTVRLQAGPAPVGGA